MLTFSALLCRMSISSNDNTSVQLSLMQCRDRCLTTAAAGHQSTRSSSDLMSRSTRIFASVPVQSLLVA
jgi:cytochrome P450